MKHEHGRGPHTSRQAVEYVVTHTVPTTATRSISTEPVNFDVRETNI